jgi:hypothetical protein
LIKFQNDIKKLAKEKKMQIMFSTKVMKDSELEAEKKSIELINNFLSIQKHKMRELEE